MKSVNLMVRSNNSVSWLSKGCVLSKTKKPIDYLQSLEQLIR